MVPVHSGAERRGIETRLCLSAHESLPTKLCRIRIFAGEISRHFSVSVASHCFASLWESRNSFAWESSPELAAGSSRLAGERVRNKSYTPSIGQIGHPCCESSKFLSKSSKIVQANAMNGVCGRGCAVSLSPAYFVGRRRQEVVLGRFSAAAWKVSNIPIDRRESILAKSFSKLEFPIFKLCR